jgi:hypothetical protein
MKIFVRIIFLKTTGENLCPREAGRQDTAMLAS